MRCFYIRFCLLILAIPVLFNSLNAQMMYIQKESLIEAPHFRTSFIKQNGIRELKEKISSKKIGDIIHSKSMRYIYFFDSSGYMSKKYKIINLGYDRFDTSVIAYIRDDSLRLNEIRYKDENGYYAYRFQYDSLNRVIKKSYLRVDNLSENIAHFTSGREVVVTNETKEYIKLSPLQYKKIDFNNNGKEYKQTTYTFDEYTYLKRKDTKFIFGNIHSYKEYEYNKKGWLEEKTEHKEGDDKVYKYQYDDVGNILQIDIYLNGTHQKVQQFLYKPETSIMYAILEKEVASKLITIKQFEVVF